MSEGVAPLVSKRSRIVYLLEHWEDIFSPPVSIGLAGSGASSGTPHLSPMASHRSVVELVRCLGVLKSEGSGGARLHDHLKAYFVYEWRIRVRAGTRKRKRGKVERLELRDRVRVVPGWAKAGYANQGVDRLVELFEGDVFIPGELWDALTLSSEEIAVKELRRRSRLAA